MTDAAEAFQLGEKAITELIRQLDAERVLADILAAALERCEDTCIDGFIAEDARAALARYREARQ